MIKLPQVIFVLHQLHFHLFSSGGSVVEINTTAACFPDSSFHEEVDAATGATLLWNKQKQFENIDVTSVEQFALIYPFMNSVFPADFSPALSIWKSAEFAEQKWHISFRVADFSFKTTTKETRFVTDANLWEELKQKSKNQKIRFIVKNKNIEREVTFSFLKDPVNAPISHP